MKKVIAILAIALAATTWQLYKLNQKVLIETDYIHFQDRWIERLILENEYLRLQNQELNKKVWIQDKLASN